MQSSTPLIFRRTKSKPAQRTRPSSPDNDNGDVTTATDQDSPSTLAMKLKNKVKKSKPKSRLSFGGDDDEGGSEEVFQVKKSSLSRKVALGKHPASIMPANLDQVSISPRSHDRPTYNKAYLDELKANTPTSRPPPPANDPYDADMSMDVGDISMQSVDSVESVDIFASESFIPAESSIKVAKERRERLRATGTSDEGDFISLSVTRRGEEPQGPHPESRLVREEDELGEGDDEFAEYTSAQDRIALGKKSRKLEASKRRDAMKEMIADAEEEDEETQEWEQEQLRRGGHTTPEPTNVPKVKQTYRPAPIPAATPVPSLAPALARLTQQLTQLTTSHASNTAALNLVAQERNAVDEKEKEMREMVIMAEEKRSWFGQFSEWVEGVAGFLDEKYPQLEKLEEEHVSLIQEKLDMIVRRRRADDDDDLSIFFGPLPNPPEPETEEIDDTGQVVPRLSPTLARHERRAARVARRALRRSQLQHKQVPDEEGYSTDSSLSPSDASSYQAAILSLAKRTRDVLSDVRAEEFRDPGKGRWKEWRERYRDTYVGAWGGLGVVSVWEFWVRLELVGWDCIEDPRSMDTFKWYHGLYEYSHPDGEDDDPGSPDTDLLASMISTAVIPRICKVIEGGALDVYSEKHTRRIVDLAEEVEASVGKNDKFQTLLKSVVKAFGTAITETETLLAKYTMSPQAAPFNPEAIPARQQFMARRMKLLKNLLRWRKYTGETHGVGLLIERVVERCVLEVAETGWETGGEDTIRKIAAVLPSELISHAMRMRLGVR